MGVVTVNRDLGKLWYYESCIGRTLEWYIRARGVSPHQPTNTREVGKCKWRASDYLMHTVDVCHSYSHGVRHCTGGIIAGGGGDTSPKSQLWPFYHDKTCISIRFVTPVAAAV